MKILSWLNQTLYINRLTSSIFNIFMNAVIVISIISPFLDLLGYITIKYFYAYYAIIEISCINIFIIEYILNMLVSLAINNKNIKKTILHPSSIVDLISFLPYFIIPHPFGYIILLDRFLKLKRFNKGLNEWFNVIKEMFFELSVFFLFFLFFIFVSSILIFVVEHNVNNQFKNLGDALWWSIVTITTVGYGDIYPITKTGKLIAAFVMIIGISSIAILTSIISTSFMNRLIKLKINKEELMITTIQKLKNHFIICGFGKMGEMVAKELSDNHKNFVIIEKDELAFKNATAKGYLVIKGDATEDEVLKSANIVQAKAIVLLMNSDATNLYTLIISKEENKGIMIIARSNSKESSKKFVKLGAKVISPYQISAYNIGRMLITPAVAEFMSIVRGGSETIEIGEFLITGKSKYSGKKIKETDIRSKYNIIIIEIIMKNKQIIFNPQANDTIEENSTIICVGERKYMYQFEKIV